MASQTETPVYIIGAARTPSVRYRPSTFRSMTDLLAQAVRTLGSKLGRSFLPEIDTVYATYRYPVQFEQRFDADAFIAKAGLRDAENLRFRIDPLGGLGGLGAVDEVVRDLARGEPSTVLVVGGEAFEPSVARALSKQGASVPQIGDEHDRPERRFLLSRYGGLEADDRLIGLTPPSTHGLVADALFRESGMNLEQMRELMCRLACHLEKYAAWNDNSYQNNRDERGRPMRRIDRNTYESEEASRTQKWPFHRFDICGIVNSAAALVLTNAPRNWANERVRVAACVVDQRGGSGGLLGRGKSFRLTANREVWRELSRRLGFPLHRPEPGGRRHLFELVDTFVYQIPMTFMDMQMYADLGSFLTDLSNDYFEPVSDSSERPRHAPLLPTCGALLNPSGGSRDGTPHSGYALVRAAECFRFLTGDSFLPKDSIDHAFVHALSLSNTAGVMALTRDGER